MISNIDAQVVIKPNNDRVDFDYMEKLSDLINEVVRQVHIKNPRGPYLEVSFQIYNKDSNTKCQHSYVLEEIVGSLVVLKCTLCKDILNARIKEK